MRQVQFKDFVWFQNFDKESIWSLYNSDDNWKSITLAEKGNEKYELLKSSVEIFRKNKCTAEAFKNKVEELGEEYSVLVKDELICFVSLDYTIRSKCFNSFAIPECGRFDLEIIKVHDSYFSFFMKDTKSSATGYVIHDSENNNFQVYLDEESKIGSIAINVISTLLSECVTQ